MKLRYKQSLATLSKAWLR